MWMPAEPHFCMLNQCWNKHGSAAYDGRSVLESTQLAYQTCCSMHTFMINIPREHALIHFSFLCTAAILAPERAPQWSIEVSNTKKVATAKSNSSPGSRNTTPIRSQLQYVSICSASIYMPADLRKVPLLIISPPLPGLKPAVTIAISS